MCNKEDKLIEFFNMLLPSLFITKGICCVGLLCNFLSVFYVIYCFVRRPDENGNRLVAVELTCIHSRRVSYISIREEMGFNYYEMGYDYFYVQNKSI